MLRKISNICLLLLAMTAGTSTEIQAAAPMTPMDRPQQDITGFWLTENGDGGVELYHCGEKICGRLHWLGTDTPDPNSPAARDERNPDPSKRNRMLCGLEFMGGFAQENDGNYSAGWIYSPRHGQKFSAEIHPRDPNTLELRGYLLHPALGQSQTWVRAENLPDCHDALASAIKRSAPMPAANRQSDRPRLQSPRTDG